MIHNWVGPGKDDVMVPSFQKHHLKNNTNAQEQKLLGSDELQLYATLGSEKGGCGYSADFSTAASLTSSLTISDLNSNTSNTFTPLNLGSKIVYFVVFAYYFKNIHYSL